MTRLDPKALVKEQCAHTIQSCDIIWSGLLEQEKQPRVIGRIIVPYILLRITILVLHRLHGCRKYMERLLSCPGYATGFDHIEIIKSGGA